MILYSLSAAGIVVCFYGMISSVNRRSRVSVVMMAASSAQGSKRPARPTLANRASDGWSRSMSSPQLTRRLPTEAEWAGGQVRVMARAMARVLPAL